MTDSAEVISLNSTSSAVLREVMKNCVNFQSYDSLPLDDYNDVYIPTELTGDIYIDNLPIMISPDRYSLSSTISTGSFVRDECKVDDIVEVDDGRLSLAYENLKNIPRQIAEKFAPNIKHLDLSFNNFRNLTFLEYFKDLDTLILDRNTCLNVNTFPYLPKLKILWLNNCDIKNVLAWVQCIAVKCKNLKQLSIMGNPGIKGLFKYYIENQHLETSSFGSFTYYGWQNSMAATSIVTDYRLYILEMLPQLEYLNDSERKTILEDSKNHSLPSSPSPSLSNGGGSTSASQCNVNRFGNEKSSTSLSFKNLFRFKRSKSSYPSSSTT